MSNVHLSDNKDIVLCKLKKDGMFTVKSFYVHLVKRDDGVRFPAQQIWKVKAPPRIAFFAWEAGQECILTIDNLMRIGKSMVNDCYMCKKTTKSCNHILLWCPVVYNIWTIVNGLLGIN